MSELTKIMHKFHQLRATLRDNKPEDKSELDRRFAVTITDLEKVMAYFRTFVMPDNEDDPNPNP